jgi:hypothetical protein
MLSLPLTPEREKTEWDTIKTIAKSNNFPIKIIKRLKSQIQQKTRTKPKPETEKKTKWAVLTYHNPNIRKITNLFKHTNINIAFRNTNTLQCLSKQKPPRSKTRT